MNDVRCAGCYLVGTANAIDSFLGQTRDECHRTVTLLNADQAGPSMSASIDRRSRRTARRLRLDFACRSLGKVPKQIRQLDGELSKPGILLKQPQQIIGFRLLRFKYLGLFKQRRQDCKKVVALILPVVRRMSDVNGKSPI